jgi:hypothetical protein
MNTGVSRGTSIPAFLRWKRCARLMLALSLCSVACVWTSTSQAQAGYANGIVIYKQPLDTDATAHALLYRHYFSNGPYLIFDTGAPQKTWLESGVILATLEFGYIFTSDLNHAAARNSLDVTRKDLAKWAARSSNAAPVIKGVTDYIDSIAAKYDAGEVRISGEWKSKAVLEAKEKMMAKAKEEEDAKRQVLVDNMRGRYPSIAAASLLSFFEAEGSVFAKSAAGSEGFADLDVALSSRSVPIISPLQGSEAGVYSSDEAHGPTVIWMARNGKIICLLVGFCLDPKKLLSREKQEELELTRNFLGRIDRRIYDRLPDELAAYSVRAVLRRKHVLEQGVPLDGGKFLVQIMAHSQDLTPHGTGDGPIVIVIY